SPELAMEVVGLVDDDPTNHGRALHGIVVAGDRHVIPSLSSKHHADTVLLAIPTARSDEIRDIAEICERAEVSLRVLPSVREIIDGRVSARDLRDLQIEDLLGRQQVETDLAAVR